MAVFISNLDDFISPSQACVNPFISQSAPEVTLKGSSNKIVLENDFSSTSYDFRSSTSAPDLIKAKDIGNIDKVARVSLSDCLACSGCVTSAEAVLIQEQSHERLLAELKTGRSTVVLSLSTQSRASLAANLGLSAIETIARLSVWLKRLGVKYIFDVACAGDIALMEARAEFLHRYTSSTRSSSTIPNQTSNDAIALGTSGSSACTSETRHDLDFRNKKLPTLLPPPTIALSSTRISALHPTPAELYCGPPNVAAQLQLPLLSSTCPGWVCYAEKSHPETLPLLCTTKSAQHVAGAVFKALVAPQCCGLSPTQIFHVAVMPCFDKKLEASRKDFIHDPCPDDSPSSEPWREVDLVLSTGELWNLLVHLTRTHTHSETQHARPSPEANMDPETTVDKSDQLRDSELEGESELCPTVGERLGVGDVLRSLPISADDVVGCDDVERMFRAASEEGRRLVMAADSNSGSGGLLEHIARYAAEQLFGRDLWAGPALEYKQGRNADIAEVLVDSGDGIKPPLRFAKVYGFRNIQSVVQALRRGKCAYDFVEVMACPSGCLNGGGQLKGMLGSGVEREGTLDGARGLEVGVASVESPAASRARLSAVESVFHDQLVLRRPEYSPLARWLYAHADGRLQRPMSDEAIALLHTRFHVVPKLEEMAPLAAKW